MAPDHQLHVFPPLGTYHTWDVPESVIITSCSPLLKHSIDCINKQSSTLGMAAAGAIGKSIGATEASAKPKETEKSFPPLLQYKSAFSLINSSENFGGTSESSFYSFS